MGGWAFHAAGEPGMCLSGDSWIVLPMHVL
jgi:hypothetical protein